MPHGRRVEHYRVSLCSNRGFFLALGAALGAREYCGRRRTSVHRSRRRRSFLFSPQDARTDADLLRPVLHSLCRQVVGSSLILPLSLRSVVNVLELRQLGHHLHHHSSLPPLPLRARRRTPQKVPSLASCCP